MWNKTKPLLPSAVWALTLIVIIINVVEPSEARHLFYFTSSLAVLFWLLDWKKPGKEEWGLLIVIAAYAFYRLGHTLLDAGTLVSPSDSQRVSISIAQRFMMGGVLATYLSINRRYFRSWWVYGTLFATLIFIAVYAGYSEFVLEETRQQREQRATIFAYQVVAIYLVFLGTAVERQDGNRKVLFLFVPFFLLALWVTVWTQTRAAIICLILGSALLPLFSRRSLGKRLSISVIFLVTALVIVLSSEQTQLRIDNARQDIAQYHSGENRATSLGTRFELWQAALFSFKSAPLLGPGYQQRSAIIDAEIHQGNLDPILDHYKKVSMHNELLEELSLRGLVGGFLLLALYAYLLWLALRRKSLSLFALTFAYVFFGLTDCLFFCREATTLFFALMALTLSYRKPAEQPQ